MRIVNQNNSLASAASLQSQLYQLVRAYELCNQACLAQNGVTASQGYTLLVLPEGGRASMNDLSQALGLASSTLTRYVDELVRKGLAVRRPDDQDRRVVRVELTDRGRKLRRLVQGALQEFFKQVLDEIREDERPALPQALDQVTQAINRVFKKCCAG